MTGKTDIDPDLEAELLLHLQHELDPDRACAVAGYLADRPERCAELLADAANTAMLRLALSTPNDPPPTQLIIEAQRLQLRLRGQRLLRRTMPFAASIVLFAAGWTGHVAWQVTGPAKAPQLVEAAFDAQAALELRNWMETQPESTDLNTQISAALGIDLPALPTDWVVRDAQIVATPGRPGVAISIDTPGLGQILLMVVARETKEDEHLLTAFDHEGKTVALFEHDQLAFVLVDDSGHPEQLALGAERILTRNN